MPQTWCPPTLVHDVFFVLAVLYLWNFVCLSLVLFRVSQTYIRFEDMALEDLDEEAIARMLEEADKEDVSEVDATGVKQLLLTLERKINRNQMMRVKFPDLPERFVDSEVRDRLTVLDGQPQAALINFVTRV